jgi:hypothetical protein
MSWIRSTKCRHWTPVHLDPFGHGFCFVQFVASPNPPFNGTNPDRRHPANRDPLLPVTNDLSGKANRGTWIG